MDGVPLGLTVYWEATFWDLLYWKALATLCWALTFGRRSSGTFCLLDGSPPGLTVLRTATLCYLCLLDGQSPGLSNGGGPVTLAVCCTAVLWHLLTLVVPQRSSVTSARRPVPRRVPPTTSPPAPCAPSSPGAPDAAVCSSSCSGTGRSRSSAHRSHAENQGVTTGYKWCQYATWILQDTPNLTQSVNAAPFYALSSIIREENPKHSQIRSHLCRPVAKKRISKSQGFQESRFKVFAFFTLLLGHHPSQKLQISTIVKHSDWTSC